MTSESSESSMDDASVSGGARRTGAPAIGKGALPSRSSGKYPLPGPWPGLQEPQPLAVDDDALDIPVEAQDLTPRDVGSRDVGPRDVAPRDFAPRDFAPRDFAPRVTRKITRDLALEPVVPVVRRDNWLQKPEYWLADYQLLPRPRTRRVPRPKRFRPVSYTRSTMLLFVILIGIFLVSGGVVFAGQLSYDFFNSPLSLPAAHPATATTIPATATATATVIETAATATDDTAAPTATVEEPTVTPIILETPNP